LVPLRETLNRQAAGSRQDRDDEEDGRPVKEFTSSHFFALVELRPSTFAEDTAKTQIDDMITYSPALFKINLIVFSREI